MSLELPISVCTAVELKTLREGERDRERVKETCGYIGTGRQRQTERSRIQSRDQRQWGRESDKEKKDR